MIDPLSTFVDACTTLVGDALQALGYGSQPIRLETPTGGFGDLAFPCFTLSKAAKKAPAAIAEELAQHMSRKIAERKFNGVIEKVQCVNAYVNFYINTRSLMETTVNAILSEKASYGACDKSNEKIEKIILEHTSANPTGPLHVGRARNPIIGDTLARILRNAGYEVETQYYIDDLGKQVAILTWGAENIPQRFHSELAALKSSGDDTEKPDYTLVKYYQIAAKLMGERDDVAKEIDEFMMRCENGDAEALRRAEKYYTIILKGIEESLKTIGVSFDSFVRESRFVSDGSVAGVIEKLKRSQYIGEEEGAYFLELKDFGIKGKDTRFFFTRANGTSLYATRDIAYHLWKFGRADKVINVLGEDHRLEAQQIMIALELLGVTKKFETVFYSFVSLPEGRMSTRRGRVVYLDDLIDEIIERAYAEVKKRRDDISDEEKRAIARLVGLGALRYNIIKVQADKGIVFNWDEALSFEGNSAPFIQYSHARAANILKKAAASVSEPDTTLLVHESETALIKILAKYPLATRQCAEGRAAHPLAKYAYDVATAFNQFYRDCKVISDETALQNARLALVACTKQVLVNVLSLLGIAAPEEM